MKLYYSDIKGSKVLLTDKIKSDEDAIKFVKKLLMNRGNSVPYVKIDEILGKRVVSFGSYSEMVVIEDE